MPVIQVQDKTHTLRQGQTRVGAGPGVDVSVSSDASLGLQALLELDGNNRAIIRRARDGANVRVNGVSLGVEPTPLMHGDKVEIAGTEILFSDDKKVGATQYVSTADIANITAKRTGPARATAATGGRLVSLVDGKEYTIGANGISIGREAGCEVVVPQSEVSRKHATIAPAENGYVLSDLSTNGVFVNGNRIQGTQVLARSDVVRIGTEEFRFYADVAPTPKGAPTPAAQKPAVPSTPATPPASAPAAPAAAAPPSQPAPAPAPAAPRAAAPAATPPAAAAPVSPPPRPAAPKPEPATTPKPLHKLPPAGQSTASKPKEVHAEVSADAKKGGVPAWVWIVIVIIVAAAAFFLGKGRG